MLLETRKQTASRLYLSILRILNPKDEPITSEDVKVHAVAELFLEHRLPPEWTPARIFTLAEWIEGCVTKQIGDSEALVITSESVRLLEEAVGVDVAKTALALAGVYERRENWFYGHAHTEFKARAKGAIPPYRLT